MENDLITKVLRTVSKEDAIEEADVRSLMVVFRKILDGMPQSDQQSFLIIRLFANWAVHNEVTQSNTGLRILSAVNDALVEFRSAETEELRVGISKGIGFVALRGELTIFFSKIQINDTLVSDDQFWKTFVTLLIEIIRDIPLSFPDISSLDKKKQKIYDQIASNPIKPGAGVVSIQISNVDYDALGAENVGNIICLIIVTEDTTKIVIPLDINVGS